jgi:hypothetical protein
MLKHTDLLEFRPVGPKLSREPDPRADLPPEQVSLIDLLLTDRRAITLGNAQLMALKDSESHFNAHRQRLEEERAERLAAIDELIDNIEIDGPLFPGEATLDWANRQADIVEAQNPAHKTIYAGAYMPMPRLGEFPHLKPPES